MNKILTLYNIEFKRIYKLYFALIGILFFANLGGVALSIKNSVSKISMENNLARSLDVLKSNIGISFINQFTVNDIYIYGSIALGIAVLMCLLYALVIWYRDYYSKSKTIYTLLSLPQPRFNIYLAKLITIVVMIYGLIASQFLFWYIDLNIVKILADINSPSFVNVFTNMMQKSHSVNIVSAYMIDFLMRDVIGVILAVVVIFTGVMIERSINKIGIILGGLYITLSIFIYVFIVFLSGEYITNLLMTHIIYFVFLFIISIFISYKLINKKVYV